MSTETEKVETVEYDDGSKLIITTTEETEFVESPDAAPIESVAIDAVEPVADSMVQIAEIEAERDITIAAIHADVETTAIEARSDEGNDEWRQNIETRVDSLNSKLDLLIASSTPQQSPQLEVNQVELPALESVDPTQDSQEQVPAKAEEPQKPRKKSRWI